MKSATSATSSELLLFLAALAGLVSSLLLPRQHSYLLALLDPTALQSFAAGVLLLWGLPLWRRLYLAQRPAAGLVLLAVVLLVIGVSLQGLVRLAIIYNIAGIAHA